MQDAATYAEHARRRTITALDVVYSLKKQGKTLFYPFYRKMTILKKLTFCIYIVLKLKVLGN